MLFTEGTIKLIYFWTKFLTFKLSTCTDNAPKVSNRNTISVADIASTSCQYMLKPFLGLIYFLKMDQTVSKINLEYIYSQQGFSCDPEKTRIEI